MIPLRGVVVPVPISVKLLPVAGAISTLKVLPVPKVPEVEKGTEMDAPAQREDTDRGPVVIVWA
ncbi:hypothetical protein GCM10027347_03050 [Larkinella harenae]